MMIRLFRKGQLAGMNAQSGMMSGRAGAQVIPLFYFYTLCSTHPFPLFTLSPLTVHVLCLSFVVVSYCPLVLLLVFFSYLPFSVVFIPSFSHVLTGSEDVFDIFFNRILFGFVELGLDLWEGTRGGEFILNRLPVQVWVFRLCKCAVQRYKPILAAGSLSNFLFKCTPALSFLSSTPAHSFDLSLLVKAFRQTKVTADFSSNHIKLTTQGCSQLWAISVCIRLFSYFLSFLLALSVFLSLLNGRIPIHDSLSNSFIYMRASHVWAI